MLYGNSVEQAVSDIKAMRVQGARSIALVGLNALKDVAAKKGFGPEFDRACKILETSRPTGVALHNAIDSVKKKRIVEEIDRMIYYFENAAPIIASKNYSLIKAGSAILTHCHSSVVVELMKRAWDKKTKFRVIVTETRPLLQGKKTAKELSEYGIPVTYTSDLSFGHIWQAHKGKIDMVLLGIDAIRTEGVVNKIGSYVMSVFAKENKIPVYFVGEMMKMDRRKSIEIEERNPEELISQKELPEVTISNAAFDTTPWKYVTGVATEKGILKPGEILRRLKG